MKRYRFAVTTALALTAYTILSFLSAHGAAAQSGVLGNCPGSNALDEIPNIFCNATMSWLSNGLQNAQRFFFLLVGIELAWSAILWVFQKENLGELLASFIVKMMGVWFFYGLLLNGVTSNWLPQIMQSFIGLGGQVTGIQTSLDPMSIFNIGIGICNFVFNNLPGGSFYFNILNIGQSIADDLTVAFCMFIAIGFAALICFMVFLAFLIAAGQLIMTLIEAYIMVGAGAVFLGFTGSRWTISFGEKWISYAVSIGVKLFVTYIIVALGLTLFPQNGCQGGFDPSGICQTISNIHNDFYFTGTGSINNLGPMVVDYLIVGAAAIIFMMLTTRLPGLAASMMNGSPNLTLNSAITTMKSVAGAVAGTVGAVVDTAKTVVTEGQAAVMDAAMLAAGAAGGAAGAGGAGGAGGAAGMDAGAADMGASQASSSVGQSLSAPESAASSGGGSSSVPVWGHVANAVAAPVTGTFAAVGAAASPLLNMDEGGGGGSVHVGLRMPE